MSISFAIDLNHRHRFYQHPPYSKMKELILLGVTCLTYILAVDKSKVPEQDDFYKFYLRVQARGWPVEIMEGDHNVQRSHPQELVKRIEQAP